MDLRYEGAVVNGCAEPDLILTDDLATLVAGSNHHMGMACTVVSWHAQDPVDDRERRRNHVVYVSQQNRNPFIDEPRGCEHCGHSAL